VILRSPGKMFIIWPICSNDYASKTRIEILCKKPVPMPQDVFVLKLISLVIPGMMEPWPECQPEQSWEPPWAMGGPEISQ